MNIIGSQNRYIFDTILLKIVTFLKIDITDKSKIL